MSASKRTEPEHTPFRSDDHPAAEGDAVLDAVLLEWTVHLLQRDPRRAWGVVLTALFAAAAGIVFFHSLLFALAGLLLILSSSAEFLLPIHHRLTATKATISFGLTRLEIPWSALRRVIPMQDGVKLSPLPFPSRLDAFRGVLLRFAADGSPGDRAQVMRIVEARLPSTEESASAATGPVSQNA